MAQEECRNVNRTVAPVNRCYTHMEPHRWIDIRLVHGPVLIRGNIVRAIEAKDNRGGTLRSVEKWSRGQWCSGRGCGGWRTVLQSPPASLEELRVAGVTSEAFPSGYTPLAKCV